ncbi:MAG: hypothetical protein KC917_11225 [Candidatus Omnitrophica bacterium]|nr:hypothetical protein [Candidatus Omnitrophota bacterium]
MISRMAPGQESNARGSVSPCLVLGSLDRCRKYEARSAAVWITFCGERVKEKSENGIDNGQQKIYCYTSMLEIDGDVAPVCLPDSSACGADRLVGIAQK